MDNHETYMLRCLELAALGAGSVAPNPMVGAVLVHENCIIGEGFHMQYGQAHAEVNCINSVSEANRHLLTAATMYVSLEPCAHYGKTPPCADLIIAKKIPRVVAGIRDPFTAVNGKGIEKLQAAGIEVIQGVLENECRNLNKRFFTFHTRQRPYIVLKWAQTADGFIAAKSTAGHGVNIPRLHISNAFTNRLVHKWRSEEAGILAGTNTALSDNPRLDNRLWHGKPPVRLVIDKHLRLPAHLNIFTIPGKTIVFNYLPHKEEEEGDITFYKIDAQEDAVHEICKACYRLHITSILVEGGTQLLQSFVQQGLWDEARTITNEKLYLSQGLAAPLLSHHSLTSSVHIFSDRIDTFTNTPA